MTPLKNYSIVFILLLILFPYSIKSIDTTSTKYFPLSMGNVWVYHYTSSIPTYDNLYLKKKVDSTAIFNGHLFYRLLVNCRYISGAQQCSSPYYEYFRVDSMNGRLYQYNSNYTCSYYISNYNYLDSLQARLNDSEYICGSVYFNYGAYHCTDTTSSVVLNFNTKIKIFTCYAFENDGIQKYARGIGLYFREYSPQFSYFWHTLVGCVINGVVYGDTTFITGINYPSSEIPTEFKLFQNYPNPFNPTTKIKFAIPSNVKSETSNVKLIVYDILGHAVATLVNDKLSSGTYEVEWDGSSYASGVYYYKLMISDPETSSGFIFSVTKKLILLK